MKKTPLVMSLLLFGLAACRRAEDRTPTTSETREIVETAVNSVHSTEPEQVDEATGVPRRVGGSTQSDPDYTRILDEIAACDRELEPLEAKLAAQNQVVDMFSTILSSENEVPEGVKELLRERQSTRASIESINDRRLRLFKEGEDWMRRHRD